MTAKRPFRFQRFAVHDDQCGMKVGVDAVLLGAWARIAGCKRFLDIGTGSGLIALMLAQRTETSRAQIDAIDIEPSAVAQAQQNGLTSPWPTRLLVHMSSLQEFADKGNLAEYDHCVCNPPYFDSGFDSPDSRRRQARQSSSLGREVLFRCSRQLLRDSGKLSLILPFDQLNEAKELVPHFRFYVSRQTSVRPLPGKPFNRVLLELSSQPEPLEEDELTVELTRHEFTPEYAALTRMFHLRYAK